VEIRDYLRILRNRWKLIAAVLVLSMLAALAASLLTTPKYAASTQLFVSTTAQDNTASAYQGGLFSQQRVTSYAQLIQGQQVAQRVIDTLRLPISAGQVTSEVSVKTLLNSVILGVTVTDASPERARDIANALSTEFTKMVAELETPQGSTTAAAKVTVVQQASLPTVAVEPQTARNVALGAVVGLLLGIVLAVLRDRLDNTVKNRKQVTDAAGAAMVGAVPFDGDRPKHPVVSFGEGHSSSAESFRQLRTNLQFLDVDNPPRVLVVSSAIPGEGKTVTALNLAFVLAEAGHRVALVEADLRRPRVARYLQLVESVGLSNVLSGAATLDDVLQATGNQNVSVLAAGPHPPNPSELLGSSHMQHVLDELRGRFDYVVLDAPPLLPVTDAAVLTNQVDGALVVARYGHTKRDQITRAVENLRAIDARVLGVILNMVPSKSTGYEYAYYYETDPAPASVSTRNVASQAAGMRAETDSAVGVRPAASDVYRVNAEEASDYSRQFGRR
jgi:capsular exopolysaccharide synthesis family protein